MELTVQRDPVTLAWLAPMAPGPMDPEQMSKGKRLKVKMAQAKMSMESMKTVKTIPARA